MRELITPIDPQRLLTAFVTHVGRDDHCESARFVGAEPAAFEGWFTAELVPVLTSLGTPRVEIRRAYRYPIGGSADLVVDGQIVFELKSFVKQQDSRKMEDFPQQLERLRGVVLDGTVSQGIAFVTFHGYSKKVVSSRLGRFFSPPWNVFGPQKMFSDLPLEVVVASITRTMTSDTGSGT